MSALVSLGVAAADAATTWFTTKKDRTKAKAEQAIEVTKHKAAVRKRQMDLQAKAMETRAGIRRALIKKNVRYLRWASFTILFLPLAVGAVEVALTGQAAGVKSYFAAIDDSLPEWWVESIQAVIAFLWAMGEAINVGNDMMEGLMDMRQAKAEEKRADANREQERERAEAARAQAERESRKRLDAERGVDPDARDYTGKRGGP